MSNTIRNYITKMAAREDLTREEAEHAFQIIMNGGATPAQMAAFLVAMRMKGETPLEIVSGARAMRAKMVHLNPPYETMDVCGTGGDAHGTVNISTAVAIVVAACGVKIAKHGNRSVSSNSGSSDVLKELGVEVETRKELQLEALEACNIGFLMAPIYHPAMRHVAPVRRELGMRTVFNLLGPLTNPAEPTRQMLGVYAREWQRPMAEALHALGVKHAWVVHGADGMDELTTTGTSHIVELRDGTYREFTIEPEDAGLERVELAALKGKDAVHNAQEMGLLFSKKPGAYRDIVLLNAAGALMVAEKVANLKDGVAMAAEAIDSGKAKETLATLAYITQKENQDA